MDPKVCNAVLIPSVSAYKSDEKLVMHMLNVIEEETYSEIKESVNLSQAGEFSDLTEGLRAFGSFDGGYDEFNTARTEYFEHKEFNFSKDQSIESLQTGLPIHVTNAWSQCIAYANDDRSGFKIWCSFLSKTIAIIVVEYHHTAGAPRQISVRNSFLTGATSNLSQMPGQLYDEGTIINEGTSRIVLQRTNGQVIISLNVSIGADFEGKQLTPPEPPVPDIVTLPIERQYTATFQAHANENTIIVASGKFGASRDRNRITETTRTNYIQSHEVIKMKDVTNPTTFHAMIRTTESPIWLAAQTNPRGDNVITNIFNEQGDLVWTGGLVFEPQRVDLA